MSISLLNENGKFIISNYGSYPAFCFEGPTDFIERCHNLVVNFEILKNGDFYKFSECIYYVLAPETRILCGLHKAFEAEVSINGEIPFVVTIIETEDSFEMIVTQDEMAVWHLAREKTEVFWLERIEKDNFLYLQPTQHRTIEYAVEMMKHDDMPVESLTE